METFKALGAALFLAGITSAAMAGEKSAPAQAASAVVVVKGSDGGCESCASASGRSTFGERRAARVGSRSGLLFGRGRGACGSAGGSCATEAVAVTETPAVIRTESVYQTRKVGERTVIAPAKQAK